MNRKTISLENRALRVTCSVEGAHIAELLHKASGVNPLWVPPWPSIEPTTYSAIKHPEYGTGDEAKLLAGILGHNICLDTFGGPSPEEAAAGMGPHGEGPVIAYEAKAAGNELTLSAVLPLAQLRFTRRLRLEGDSPVARISESIENLSAGDRPIAWTQHVTLGPPFLVPGETQFHMPATKSKVAGAAFNDDLGPYVPEAEFDWPHCPLKAGSTADFRVFTAAAVSGGFTTHLMDPAAPQSFFLAWSPATKVLIGYVWRQTDFPWMARWEESRLRTAAPWHGKAVTCGMEFGVSPTVESRRKMVERGLLFGVPCYRWLPARSATTVHYAAFVTTADSMPAIPPLAFPLDQP